METKVEKEWTFDQPTKEGYYWVEEGINKLTIVKIRKSLFGEKKLVIIFPESKESTDLAYIKGLKWYGPITPPPIELIEEETNEKSNS